MPDQPTPGDVLEQVAGWLDRLAASGQTPGDRPHPYADTPSRFCQDVGQWVRAVKHEMSELRRDFERGIDAQIAAENTAAALSRIADQTQGLTELAKSAIQTLHDRAAQTTVPTTTATGLGPTPKRTFNQVVTPDHVEKTQELRSGVAAFREKLRQERAERAARAAEERKRFVDNIRRERQATDATREHTPTEHPDTTVDTSARAPEPTPEPDTNHASHEPAEPHDDGFLLSGPLPESYEPIEHANEASSSGETNAQSNGAPSPFRRADAPLPAPPIPDAPIMTETAPSTPTPGNTKTPGIRFRRVD